MTEQTQTKAIQVSNYDKIKAMAKNETVVKSFAQTLGGNRLAMSYITSTLLAVANSPKLMECEPASVWSTALRAASLRLSCDPALGQAFPVPYNGKATLQLGYRGIEQMALRTDKYRFINTGEIFEGQVIEVNQLTGATQIRGQRNGDKVLGYFNYFELFNGFSHSLYMTVEEIHAHAKQYSQTYKYESSKWHSEFPKMAKKTVLRMNLLRHGYLTAEDRAILDAMGEDNEFHPGGETIDTTFEDVKVEIIQPEPKSENQLMSELGLSAEPAKPQPEAPKPAPVAQSAVITSAATLTAVDTIVTQMHEAMELYANRPAISAAQRGVMASHLENVFDSGDKVAKRHAILKALTGVTSLKDVNDETATRLYFWLRLSKIGDTWKVNEQAAAQLNRLMNAIDAQGQQTLI